jgi:hypothetical protein
MMEVHIGRYDVDKHVAHAKGVVAPLSLKEAQRKGCLTCSLDFVVASCCMQGYLLRMGR